MKDGESQLKKKKKKEEKKEMKEEEGEVPMRSADDTSWAECVLVG